MQRKLALFLVALVGGFAGCDQTPKPKEPSIQMASIWEVTGQVAQYGEAAQKAANLAVEEYNRSRSPNLPRILLASQDTQSTPQGAALAFQAALAQGRPIAVLGPLTSAAAMVISPLAEREGIVIVSTASTPDLTRAGPFTFRIYPSDTYEAQEMARFARQNGTKTAVVVYPQNDYGVGLDAAFVAAAAPDIEVRARVPYPSEQTDFRVIAAKALNWKPDSIYAPGYPATVAPLARNLRSAGFKGSIYSSLGIEDPSLFELGGAAVDGIVYTVTAIPGASLNPARAQFEKLFRERYRLEPGFPALYGWDVASIVIQSVTAGARSVADLQAALGDGKTFEGATGRFTFDRNGDVRRSYALKRVLSASRSFEVVAQ